MSNTSFLEQPPPVASSEYQDAFKQLTILVRKKVMTPEKGYSIFNLHHSLLLSSELRSAREDMAKLFVQDAEILLRHAEAGRALFGSGSLFSSAEAGDRLLERLTGTWLAMYFLGCPNIQPWEAVAFFAEGSGFPLGASLCKAAGDVYRGARKAWIPPLHKEPNPSSDQTLYVLDHNPLAIQRMMNEIDMRTSDGEQADGPTLSFSTYIAALGMLYERLQLALYLHSGAPMHFYVHRESLRSAMRHYADKTVGPPLPWNWPEEIMWREIESCFPEKFAADQLVHIADDDTLSYMPGCVLAPHEGMYRSREAHVKEKHAQPGNYLPTRLHAEFRNNLKKATPTERERVALQCNHDMFVAECKRVTYLSTRPAESPPASPAPAGARN